MEKKQVFISYKSEEFDEALWVKNSLEQQGISCWMAPMCITGGASYAAEIPAAINNCTVFVLILSEKVQQSKWVPRELDQAINVGKIIIPFTLEDCQLKDEFKFYLSNIQRYYAYQDKLGTMEIMSREIRSVLGIPEPPEEEPVVPEEKPEEPPKKAPSKPKAAPVQKKAPKKKKRALPIILSAVAAAIALPVLLIILISVCSRVTFADTAFKKNAYSLELNGQTVTAEDLQTLSKFKELHRISLKDCTLEAEDLSAFSGHPLWGLELEGCGLTNGQLSSIDFGAMEDLTTLNLSNNPSLDSLDAITSVADTLTTLSVGNTGIRDLKALEGFTGLTSLSVENLGLSTLQPLRMMVYLETLIADGNELEDLTGLENVTVLNKVSLRDNQLKEVECLANSAATLQRLYLDDNLLNDLSCLAGCTALTELSADRNGLTSIDWACSWSSLKRMSVSGNQLAGAVLSPPQSQELFFLDLSGNMLTDFSGFSWPDDVYVTVDLSDNELISVTLPEGCRYDRLALHGNPLTDLSFAEGATGFTLSLDYFDAMDAETVKNLSFSNLYIIDCPPNRIVELEQASSKVKLISREEVSTELPNPKFPE